MIRKEDLQEAITECLGQKNPNATTCLKLAAYYTIMENLYPEEDHGPLFRYSYASADRNEPEVISYMSGSEFSKAVNGRNTEEVMKLIDELVSAISVLNPRLYTSLMAKLSE